MIKDTKDNSGPPEGQRFSSDYQPKRRRGPSLTSELKKQLQERDPKSGKRYVEILAKSLIFNAVRGSGTAIREIFNRMDGPTPTKVEGMSGQPAIINFISSIPDEDDSLTDIPPHPMQFHEEVEELLEAEVGIVPTSTEDQMADSASSTHIGVDGEGEG
jgi:hypothetical protein